MACFLLQDKFGKTRWVSQETPYQKVNGEEIVPGQIDWGCGKLVSSSTPEDLITPMILYLDQQLKKEGLGEWIKVFAEPVAKAMGRSSCSSCDVRRVVGDALGPLITKFGRWEAFKIVAKLVRDSFSKPGMDVLKELKDYLA